MSGSEPRHAMADPGRRALEGAARRELGSRFRLDGILAAGARSMTFAALEREGERPVALRVMLRSALRAAGGVAPFQQAQRLGALDHPHVVPLEDAGTTASLAWYATKRVEGRSLATVLRDDGPLALPVCVRIAEQVASALTLAHRRGIVHADIRPGNILVDDRNWVLVANFVIGGAWNDTRSATYRAPEETAGSRPSPAGDQFAFAATLWECLTGSPPGRSPSEPPVGIDGTVLPPHVVDALRRALEPRPEARHESTLDFAWALNGAEPGPGAPPRRGAPAPGTPHPVLLVDDRARSSRHTATAITLVFAAATGWALLALPQSEPRPEPPPPPPTIPVAAPTLAMATPPRLTTSRTVEAPPAPADSTGPDAPAPTPADSAPVARDGTRAPAHAARERPTPVARPEPPPAAPLAADTVPEPPPGRLVVSSSPWGRLFVDGGFVGNTPETGLALSAGVHAVRITRPGYHPFVAEINVAPGAVVRLVHIVLAPVVTP